jgi:hypothetical protein
MPIIDWWKVWRLPTPDTINDVRTTCVAPKSASDFMDIPGEKLGAEFGDCDFNIPHIPTVATFL